jgi:hypothetical protein
MLLKKIIDVCYENHETDKEAYNMSSECSILFC